MKKNSLENILFLSLFILFWLVSGFFFLRNSQVENLVENRKSYSFESFTLGSFFSKDYQDHLELAIKDQMPKYQYFQFVYPKIQNYMNFQSSQLFLRKTYSYINLKDIYYYDQYLLYEPIQEEALETIYQPNLDKINLLMDTVDAQVYVYYLNGDTNISFEKNYRVDVDQYIKENIHQKENYSSLKIDSFEDYKKYYYQFDHHLNHIGAQKIYEDLVQLMHLGNPLKEQGETCFTNKKVYESKAKTLALNNLLKEKMCAFSYNLPSYTIEIDQNSAVEYGSSIASLKEKAELSYATIFGADYGEIIFTNLEADNTKNLLIFSNSYSNSINKLLASHYQKTYVIDGRYQADFNFISYVQEHKIDDILILSSKMLFFDQVNWGNF